MNQASTGGCPTFYILKKCDAIIALVSKHSARCLKHTHEFWVEYPKTVTRNGKTELWQDAIALMKKNQVEFDILQDKTSVLNHPSDTNLSSVI